MGLASPLRLFTAGNVDDGKSTLIGRLLYDSRSLYEDHLLSLQRDSAKKGSTTLDYSLLTDGLMAEREQGITIDVAYRYFSTSQRDFILADTPGHEQYTRNMVTAASQADVLLLVLSVERPLSLQARRHSVIASLLGIKQFVVAINKLDLVGYSQEAFKKIQNEYKQFALNLAMDHLHFIPISALQGDNIVDRSDRMIWYQGTSLLKYLETLVLPHHSNSVWRFPVQYVLRPEIGGRFYAGTLERGILKKGEETVCLSTGQKTCIQTILYREQEIEEAKEGQAIAIQLETQMDVGRGSFFAPPKDLPMILVEMEAFLIWMDSKRFSGTSSYLLMHTTQTVFAEIKEIQYVIDVQTLEKKQAKALCFNDIARVSLVLQKPIFADLYKDSRTTGSFLLIDPHTYRTLGAGLIESSDSKEGSLHQKKISVQKGCIIWFTGLPGSGKTTLARALEKALIERGKFVYVLDGDILRKGLSSDLGFSLEDRKENMRRVAEVASLFMDAGCIAIVALIAPLRSEREAIRLKLPENRFWEIYLSTPLSCCEERDPKSQYQKARQGIIADFTGISSPYEPPQNPELILDTSILSVQTCLEQILNRLSL